ncbi:SOS response-associated peptidase [Nitrospirillum amazonense]|uniref:SOS response-associated peptidase n=1 Tax=Nitrospirillum amazonense TaxID=28077 RepID=UPI0024126085|nr:SOS response-associated peptidase family protein [Nitrospirillum amazonense]MDG3444657.1 SOS response-associated peptidase family protein [Nitrospirillum amazonense]
MCNHYRAEIRKLGLEVQVYGYEEIKDLPRDIFPDRMGPVITRRVDGTLQWQAMRWGFPPPPSAAGGKPVTNVRNLSSRYWQTWLKPESRCLVPFSSFAEYDKREVPAKERWFEVPGDRPAAFAGIWRQWEGERGPKKGPVTGQHLLFSFLTCEPNSIVAPIHPKAMPVVLVGAEAQRAWLDAPATAVPAIAVPLPEEDVVMVG